MKKLNEQDKMKLHAGLLKEVANPKKTAKNIILAINSVIEDNIDDIMNQVAKVNGKEDYYNELLDAVWDNLNYNQVEKALEKVLK